MTAGVPLKAVAAAAAPVVAALAALGAVTGGAALTAITTQLSASPASPAAVAAIPPAMLTLYQQADQQTCPAMPWQIVAAIGTIESVNDTSTLPGVDSGANPWGASGPMQFEPATFAAYDQPIPPGGANPPSPYDPVDAVYAAVRMLCANGAATGDIRGATFAYNHSVDYVNQVWNLAVTYGMATDGSPHTGLPTASPAGPGPGVTSPGDPATVIAYALSQLGVPYQWGGSAPGVGLDCSGLVQLAYRAAGIALPRTTYAQVAYGITVPAGALQPGDLLFFNDGTDFGHVSIYLGNGLMIQAPYTGTVVSIAPVPTGAIELARRIIANP
ncbi:C40 family peptidase [Acidiferrimicrobium sp. IK]|uniref:C40 family peptidase n=1 Tax=Acidiferrimicrobium sp. IK TaxID=2871700 RepID=UPI0021CAE351|nr:NlpC/P60 family protein [Acidiferrimicrobium sp. IK]MCU4186449.1 C40 family peptidase [Acidiferrimicrobium sp. IK]